MTGNQRNIAEKINQLMEMFPAVIILGARQTGKTTLTKQMFPHWQYFDLENPIDAQIILQDPSFFFETHTQHIIIDEAQESDVLFRVLRGVIDQKRAQKGRFLLTGSSSSTLLKHATESLAGRAAILELGTLKANEIYQKPLSQFYNLFTNKISKHSTLIEGLPPISNADMRKAWLKGGYPEPVLSNTHQFYSEWMTQYQLNYVYRDVAKLFPHLNKQAYQRFISTLAKLSGTILNKRELARAIEISEASVRQYLSIAEGTFLWRELPSFEHSSEKLLVKMPKGYLRDSGLMHTLNHIHSLEDLISSPLIGHSFESFAIEELLKGITATHTHPWHASYYRTRNGAEIDLILEGAFGCLPIEIKFGKSVKSKQLQALKSFIHRHKLPFGCLINQGDHATWLTPEIYQIPIGWL